MGVGNHVPPERAYDLLNIFASQMEREVCAFAKLHHDDGEALDIRDARAMAMWLGVLLARTLDREAFNALLTKMFEVKQP